MPVADADREVVVAGGAQLADALSELLARAGERHGADEVRGALLLLVRTEEHEMPAVVGEVPRVRRLVLEIDLPVALEQRGEGRRHAPPHVAELGDLHAVVERDRRVRPRLSPRARAVPRLAV